MLQEKRLSRLNTAAFIVLVVLTCECVAGSSGRWLEFGAISIRMVLFIVAFVVSIPLLMQNMRVLIHSTLVQVLLIFGFFLCFSLFYGWARGNSFEFMVMDLKSFLFLLIVPGYLVVINNERRVDTVIKYASYASAALAVITIVLHFVLRYISQDTETELNMIINSMELGGLFHFGDGIYRVYFRSSVCFIIPFLYGLSLLINKKDRKKQAIPYLLMTVSLTAIVLTYTRSIWLGFAVACLLYFVINIKKYKILLKGIAIACAGFTAFIMISWLIYGFEGVISNAVTRVVINDDYLLENDLDEMRVEQLRIQIASNGTREERLNAAYSQIENNWVLGCGLGQQLDVNGYPCKIEYTYLDILGKMGVFGFISFCFLMLWPVYLVFRKNARSEHNGHKRVLTCALIGIYVTSIFNPYITSPIGLCVYALLGAVIFQQENSDIHVSDHVLFNQSDTILPNIS